MKILVTGGSGFLGMHLVKNLKELGDVFYTSRKKHQDPKSICLNFAVDDLDEKFDVIIHNAAFIPSPENDPDPNCKIINYVGTQKFVRNITKSTSPMFIYVGSLSIFGGVEGNIDLLTTPNPDSQYSESKYLAESILPANSYVVRPGTIYGPGIHKSRFISYATSQIKSNKDIKIYNPQQYFYLVHVLDVVDAIKKIIVEKPLQKKYNLSTERKTKLSICNQIKKHYNSDCSIAVIDSAKFTQKVKGYEKSSIVVNHRTFANSIGSFL